MKIWYIKNQKQHEVVFSMYFAELCSGKNDTSGDTSGPIRQSAFARLSEVDDCF